MKGIDVNGTPEQNRAAQKRWRERHPEQERERQRLKAQRERERHPERIRERQKRYNAKNADKVREANFRRYLKRNYDMTPEDYANRLAFQDGRCAICREPMVRPNVDHDHETGIVRGILCSECNSAIGLMKDDPQRLTAAAEYLDAASVQTVSEEATWHSERS